MTAPAQPLRTSEAGDQIVFEGHEAQKADRWRLRVEGEVWKMTEIVKCSLPCAKKKRTSKLTVAEQRHRGQRRDKDYQKREELVFYFI